MSSDSVGVPEDPEHRMRVLQKLFEAFGGNYDDLRRNLLEERPMSEADADEMLDELAQWQERGEIDG